MFKHYGAVIITIGIALCSNCVKKEISLEDKFCISLPYSNSKSILIKNILNVKFHKDFLWINDAPITPLDETGNLMTQDGIDSIITNMLKMYFSLEQDRINNGEPIEKGNLIAMIDKKVQFKTIQNFLTDCNFSGYEHLHFAIKSKKNSELYEIPITLQKHTKKEMDNERRFSISIFITDCSLFIAAKGGCVPNVFYREYHTYIAEDDKTEFTVEYNPKETISHPKNNRPMNEWELDEIKLYVLDDNEEIYKCFHTKNQELVTDIDRNPLQEINYGDTVYFLSSSPSFMAVDNPQAFELKPMSAYDKIKIQLLKIEKRFADSTRYIDLNDITILAVDTLKYDKLIHIIEAAKEAGYQKFKFLKLNDEDSRYDSIDQFLYELRELKANVIAAHN